MKTSIVILFSLFLTYSCTTLPSSVDQAQDFDLLGSDEFLFGEDDPNFENLQDIFNGYWEQGGLEDPKTLIKCFDLQSAQIALKFIRVMALDIYITNWIGVYKGTEYYLTLFSQDTKDCVENNPEVIEMKKAYNVTGMPLQDIEERIVVNSRKDYPTYLQLIDQLYENSQAEDFKGTGTAFGRLIQFTFN